MKPYIHVYGAKTNKRCAGWEKCIIILWHCFHKVLNVKMTTSFEKKQQKNTSSKLCKSRKICIFCIHSITWAVNLDTSMHEVNVFDQNNFLWIYRAFFATLDQLWKLKYPYWVLTEIQHLGIKQIVVQAMELLKCIFLELSNILWTQKIEKCVNLFLTPASDHKLKEYNENRRCLLLN